jgi:shikimate kinase
VAGRHPQRNIVITGFVKAGKTAVGRELARRMRRPFTDLPGEVARRQRLALSQLVGVGPRISPEVLEERLIADLAFRREVVAATGCDELTDQRVIEELRVFSFVVFLDPPFAELWRRIQQDPERSQQAEWNNRDKVLARWVDWRERYLHCDLQLVTPSQHARHVASLILHCFYT